MLATAGGALAGATSDPVIAAKTLYLNVPFFTLRAVAYFAIWGTIIYFLNKWSREQDENPPMLPGDALTTAPGLPVHALLP